MCSCWLISHTRRCEYKSRYVNFNKNTLFWHRKRFIIFLYGTIVYFEHDLREIISICPVGSVGRAAVKEVDAGVVEDRTSVAAPGVEYEKVT